jgi:hypothetical protein
LDFFNLVATNWAAIAANPQLFLALTVAAFALGFVVNRFATKSQIGALESRRLLAEERALAYKERLEGRSPDEAAAVIGELQSRLDAIEPWNPGDTRMKAFEDAISNGAGKIVVTLAISAPELFPSYRRFVQILRKNGWNVENWETLDGGNLGDRAIKRGTDPVTIYVCNDYHQGDLEILRSALLKAEIDYNEVARPENGPSLTLPFDRLPV